MVTQPIRVVVIDDTALVRDLLGVQLGVLGYAPTVAEDGESGLALVRAAPPDLVLCDLRMPGMDGLAVLKVLREEFPRLPVVVMSGAGLLNDAINALKLGAWDYVEKPFTEMGLRHAIDHAVEKARLLEENRLYRTHLEEVNRKLAGSYSLLAQDEDAGRQIQFHLLPRNHLKFGPFEFSRDLAPSAYLSGDFLDAFALDAHRFAFYIADVSGHGVSSALVTVMLRAFMQRELEGFVRRNDDLIVSPARLLEKLNDELLGEALEKHLTIFYGVIDSSQDSLVYANAGHFPWPLLFDGERSVTLEMPAAPIGLFLHSQYKETRLALPQRMVLAAFSDGLLEVLPHDALPAKLAFLAKLFGRLDVTVEDAARELGLKEAVHLPDDVAMFLIKRGDAHG